MDIFIPANGAEPPDACTDKSGAPVDVVYSKGVPCTTLEVEPIIST